MMTCFPKYSTLKKISFDYAVVEQEQSIAVMRFFRSVEGPGHLEYIDRGHAGSQYRKCDSKNENCDNVHVINELAVPVLCMGLKDVIVSASPGGHSCV